LSTQNVFVLYLTAKKCSIGQMEGLGNSMTKLYTDHTFHFTF